MKRLFLSSVLLLMLAGAAGAQISRTWIRTSVGVPTVCPSRTLTINVSNGDLYSPNGSGGCVKSSTAAATGSGDVVGPASSTDNAAARFNGTGGKTLQNSGVIIDDSNNLTASNLAPGFATTATAVGTTTLTVASKGVQAFTGATTQIVVLPVVSTLPQTGFQFVVLNDSSGEVTVNSSGGNAVQVMAAGTRATFTAKLLTGTDAASWAVTYVTAGGGGASYLVYTALLTQTSTNAPVATVLENTTGVTFTWARTSTGLFTMTADSGTPFAANKTLLVIGQNIAATGNGGEASSFHASCTRTSTTVLTITTSEQNGTGATSRLVDGALTETAIEIRIYP